VGLEGTEWKGLVFLCVCFGMKKKESQYLSIKLVVIFDVCQMKLLVFIECYANTTLDICLLMKAYV